MPNYLRNVDDTISDPDLIAVRARTGRSAFFEVALTLAEQADNVKASSGASTTAVAAAPVGGGGTVFTEGGGHYGGIDRCFAGNTPILMASGGEKPIRETLLYADTVVVPDENGKLEEGQIIYRTETMFSRWVKITFEDGRVVEVRSNHRYRVVGGGWTLASTLEQSFHLDESLHWAFCKVRSIEVVDKKGELDFYNLGVRHPAHAYVAHGDWVSNRKLEDDIPLTF